ncbi:hypothetical protein LTR01_004661 [Friedmanniomyces endolithicus]|nr:hypothetical protein LTS09_014835 [Friedmanniomyces endolithicus]KAK0308782.1 hypothetical protein LTR01_004661 [Friedmanniomyces endolithicus]KAK0829796.1 hypothetical protein LTR73_003932 [Friedmanniomyces endolithicus]
MDGQYPPPRPPINTYYPTYPNAPPPIYPPEPFPPRLHHLQTVSMESLGAYSDYEDPNRAMLPPGQIQPRQRRRQATGSEHVKHRRTRSGCYTCRQRRVKCDETHPMCERCRKGKRECAYPGETPTSSVSKNSLSSDKSKGSHESTSSTSEDESDDDAKPSLAAIPDDDEDAAEDAAQSAVSEPGRMSGVVNVGVLPNTTPIAERTSGIPRGTIRSQSSRTAWKHSAKPNISQNARWASLPREVKSYLRYHRDSMSHHHYGFKYDAGDFLKTTYLEIAVNDDSAALLYGIVAFAAYHHALTHQTDIISRFLAYYNQSIMLLQQALKKKRHNVATLLTILQLATIEEFLGDWTNLLGHQRAAHQILTDLFTPQTIMQDETRRRIISWYIRFDLFAASMAGTETNLGREWFAACAEFYTLQARERPHDLGATFEKFFSTSRLLATDSTLLFAAKKKNTLSDEQFAAEVDNISSQITRFKHLIETVFDEPANFVTVSPDTPAPSAEDDITDFRDPHFLYGGDYFTMNYVLIDFWAIDMMFRNRLATPPSPQVAAQLVEIALKECKMFEAVEHCEQKPPGAILGCQASLGIASLFLPRDRKHTDWCRRKFALIEQKGFVPSTPPLQRRKIHADTCTDGTSYIYPAALRQHMSELWAVDVNHWWLPDDAGYPAVVRALRDFVQYRASMPRDALTANVSDMSGIFEAMNIAGEVGLEEEEGDLKGSWGEAGWVGSSPEGDVV